MLMGAQSNGRVRLIGAPLVAAVSLALAAPANAATVNVDAADPTADGASCGLTGNDPCNTIQLGVDHANTDDTVVVAAGVYNEAVTVTKRLILRGAKAGVDAPSRAETGETEIVPPANTPSGGAIRLTVGGSTVDGFLIRDALGAGNNTRGILAIVG